MLPQVIGLTWHASAKVIKYLVDPKKGPVKMEGSILVSIRQKLGPSGAYDVFDPQLIDFINMAFGRLHQLGIGPKERFYIHGPEAMWSDFVPDGDMEELRTYVYLKVRQIFDPPTNSSVLNAYDAQIKELEWELNALFDNTVSEG